MWLNNFRNTSTLPSPHAEWNSMIHVRDDFVKKINISSASQHGGESPLGSPNTQGVADDADESRQVYINVGAYEKKCQCIFESSIPIHHNDDTLTHF